MHRITRYFPYMTTEKINRKNSLSALIADLEIKFVVLALEKAANIARKFHKDFQQK